MLLFLFWCSNYHKKIIIKILNCISHSVLVKGNSICIQFMDCEAPHSRGLRGINFFIIFVNCDCFDRDSRCLTYSFLLSLDLCRAVSSFCHMCLVPQPGGFPAGVLACRDKMVILNHVSTQFHVHFLAHFCFMFHVFFFAFQVTRFSFSFLDKCNS